MKSIRKVSVIGLGKLGACMAACFAKRGFPVIGVDLNRECVDRINAGEAPVEETGLEAAIRAGRNQLKATDSYKEAVLNSDATFVIVPTPSEPNGNFSLQYAKKAFEGIGKALKEKEGYHLVVMTGTVLPGGTEYGLLPLLEKASGKKCGRDFGLCYSPEFIALGSVLHNFLNPDFVLIGESDKRAGGLLAAFYQKVCENNPPIAQMNIVNAELTKVAVNSFMTMKITFSNFLASLCEKLPDGNVGDVTKALALFGGVGKRSLNGGLGYGGPCLPRDNIALAYLATQLGESEKVPESIDHFNRSIVTRITRIIAGHVKNGGRIAFLGLSYKPATWVIEESQSILVVKALVERGYPLTVYDPKAMKASKAVLKESVTFAASMEEAIQEAHIIVLATPDPFFRELTFTATSLRKLVVIDVWRHFPHLVENSCIEYVPIGIGYQKDLLSKQLASLWN